MYHLIAYVSIAQILHSQAKKMNLNFFFFLKQKEIEIILWFFTFVEKTVIHCVFTLLSVVNCFLN